MTDSKPLAVVWNPGCFGNFILGIIELQKNNIEYNSKEISSHDVKSIIKKIHNRKPTQEETMAHRAIFSYFPNSHRFLPKTFHYIKFFNELPSYENFTKFNIKEFSNKCKNKREFFYKTLVTHYWLDKVDEPKNVHKLDMTELFLNTDKFKVTLENILQENLLSRTKVFIENKKQLNLAIFQQYENLIYKIKNYVLNNEEKNLENVEDYYKCLLLAEIIDYKQEMYTKFLKNFNGQELITTSDVRNIFV